MTRFPYSPLSCIITALTIAILSAVPAPSLEKEKLTPASLKRVELQIEQLTKRALPATVAIVPAGRSRVFGTGSGVIVSEDGLILTAAHVVLEMGQRVTAIFPNGNREEGKVLGLDFNRDAAMVQLISQKQKFPFVELGQSNDLQVNDWCVALGHAGGHQKDRSAPVRLGRVRRHRPNRFLTTDSALIAGDSGGPLFDLEGKLIGIHSNIGQSLSQNNHVPISAFQLNWERLKSGERFGDDEKDALLSNPDRPMIGAMLTDPSPEGKGAYVTQLLDKSPAKRAGLTEGDRIVQIGEVKIRNSGEFISEVRRQKPGETIRVVAVNPSGQKRTLQIKVASARQLRRNPGDLLRPPSRRTPKETKALQEEFNRKMRESIAEGRLKLTDDDYEKFRSKSDFDQFLDHFKKTLTDEEVIRLAELADKIDQPARPVRPESYDPDALEPIDDEYFREVLDAFRPAAARASAATHLVFRGREWKGLCTVVRKDGFAVAKASEIETKNNQVLGVLISKGRLVSASVVKTYPVHDLALLKLENLHDLTVAPWKKEGDPLPLGALVCAAGSSPHPVAVGLISVLPRKLTGDNKGFLGIRTAPHPKGVRVAEVLDTGNAVRAGVKRGDVIFKVDGTICDTPEKLIKKVSGTVPGSKVRLDLIRGSSTIHIDVTLGNRIEAEEGRMNRMGTEVSRKSTGFQLAIQTDLPIDPQHCGGPVADLNGEVIGVTIARAGRIKTYVTPARQILQLIEPVLAKHPAPEKSKTGTAPRSQ